MSDWFIQKTGFSSDKVLGPLSNEQVIALFLRGEIKKKTPIASQQHTNNEWKILGQTALWKTIQQTVQLEKQKKEQAAAEAKKQQQVQQQQQQLQQQQLQQQQLQQQQLQQQQQIVVADRQQPVSDQSLPAGEQWWGNEMSSYRKAVSQRFETSNSLFDLFDWKFEKYITPMIIRITWVIVVFAVFCMFVYFMIGPEVWASIGSGSSGSSSGAGFRIPLWTIHVIVRIVQAVMMVITLLWVRVILESMIVIFNIARGISNIEKNTGPRH